MKAHYALAIALISVVASSCTTSMADRYSDQQACYRTRVFMDGWQLGYRAFGEGHIGPYANFMAMLREVQLTADDKPYLYDDSDQRSCSARFPEVNAPLPEFYSKMDGVIPIPRFYATIMQGGTPHVPDQRIDTNTLVFLGLLIGAAGTFAPPPTPATQFIFLM